MLLQLDYYLAFIYSVGWCSSKHKLITVLPMYVMRSDPIEKTGNSFFLLMAIDEAVEYNAKTMKYITKILNTWISKGIKTAEQVKSYQKQWASKKSGSSSRNVKKGAAKWKIVY